MLPRAIDPYYDKSPEPTMVLASAVWGSRWWCNGAWGAGEPHSGRSISGQNSIKVGRIGHLEGAGSRGKGFFCALCRLDSQRCSYYVGMRGERGQDGRTPRPTYYLDVNTQLPRVGCCNGLRPPADYHTNVVSTGSAVCAVAGSRFRKMKSGILLKISLVALRSNTRFDTGRRAKQRRPPLFDRDRNPGLSGGDFSSRARVVRQRPAPSPRSSINNESTILY